MNNGYYTLLCYDTKHFSCGKLQTFTHVMNLLNTMELSLILSYYLLPIYLYHETINAVLC